ncbi:MAG: hypothetical protein NWQ38_08235 [Cellulophaga sp.]|nr:hypothetical protein [Cellulophaga sp.]
MINYQEDNQQNSLKKVLQEMIIAFKEFINFEDKDDDSHKKAQLLAQRVDGKKVPINRKL